MISQVKESIFKYTVFVGFGMLKSICMHDTNFHDCKSGNAAKNEKPRFFSCCKRAISERRETKMKKKKKNHRFFEAGINILGFRL